MCFCYAQGRSNESLNEVSLKMMLRLFLLASLFTFTNLLSVAFADESDWPQWRGPARDGHAGKQSLLESWPSGGPDLAWEFSGTGLGYSSCSVVDGRIYTLGETNDQIFAICIDLQSGKEIWRTDFSRGGVGADYNHGWGGGPRCTPTVDGDQVFAVSDVGTLASFDRETGGLQWKVEFVQDFGGEIPVWGYSESPLVDGDRVMVTPGGPKFMVGLDRKTGKEVWVSKNTDQPAQYVSIMKGKVGETEYYVTASKSGLFGFAVRNGQPIFKDSATGNNIAVIPTPIVTDNSIYHTSDYGAGNTLIKLTEPDPGKVVAETVYHMSDKTMMNHHGGVVLVDGVIYGFSKVNGNVWMAQELESGKILWEHKIRPNSSGSIAYADGMLYCYNDKDGTCALVEPNRTGWVSKGQVQLPKQTALPRDKGAIWAHPVIAGGKLIIRDQDLIFAYNIAKKKK
jgi:outer membrane protein assembly factor BamB